MWDNTSLGIQDIDIFPQGIHVAVKVIDLFSSWYFSVIYASNSFKTRKILWVNLIDFANSIKTDSNNPWFIEDDYNEVLKASEKLVAIV